MKLIDVCLLLYAHSTVCLFLSEKKKINKISPQFTVKYGPPRSVLFVCFFSLSILFVSFRSFVVSTWNVWSVCRLSFFVVILPLLGLGRRSFTGSLSLFLLSIIVYSCVGPESGQNCVFFLLRLFQIAACAVCMMIFRVRCQEKEKIKWKSIRNENRQKITSEKLLCRH